MQINLPSPTLPKALDIPQLYFRPPTADVPAYKPMVKKSGNSDITCVASVFPGALATFGLATGNSKDKGPTNCPMVKKKEE